MSKAPPRARNAGKVPTRLRSAGCVAGARQQSQPAVAQALAPAAPGAFWWELDASAVRHDDALAFICKTRAAALPHRVLALHGAASNAAATEKQIEDLGLSGRLDVVHLRAPLRVGEGAFSWWPAGGGAAADVETALRGVMKFVAKHGPFHALYGFDQGAAIAAALSSRGVAEAFKGARSWQFVICAAAVADAFDAIDALVEATRQTTPGLSVFDKGSAELPSLHVIGMMDHAHRDDAIRLSKVFAYATNVFHDGGHDVPGPGQGDALFKMTLDAFVTCPMMAPSV